LRILLLFWMSFIPLTFWVVMLMDGPGFDSTSLASFSRSLRKRLQVEIVLFPRLSTGEDTWWPATTRVDGLLTWGRETPPDIFGPMRPTCGVRKSNSREKGTKIYCLPSVGWWCEVLFRAIIHKLVGFFREKLLKNEKDFFFFAAKLFCLICQLTVRPSSSDVNKRMIEKIFWKSELVF